MIHRREHTLDSLRVKRPVRRASGARREARAREVTVGVIGWQLESESAKQLQAYALASHDSFHAKSPSGAVTSFPCPPCNSETVVVVYNVVNLEFRVMDFSRRWHVSPFTFGRYYSAYKARRQEYGTLGAAMQAYSVSLTPTAAILSGIRLLWFGERSTTQRDVREKDAFCCAFCCVDL